MKVYSCVRKIIFFPPPIFDSFLKISFYSAFFSLKKSFDTSSPHTNDESFQSLNFSDSMMTGASKREELSMSKTKY